MNLVDVDDLTTDELEAVLDRAADIKAGHEAGTGERPLADQTLAMIFEKPSTRTRWMGRASGMASRPPRGKLLGSAMPMLKVPPGIQTIPSGPSSGSGADEGTVA